MNQYDKAILIKPFQSTRLNYGKKSIAFIVMRLTLKSMAKHQKTNNGFGVMPVEKLSFTKERTINTFVNDVGLNFGFKKAIPSAGFHSFPDTANLKSSKLKIIGFIKHPSTIPTFLKSNTRFTTALTLEKITASSQ